MNNEENEPISLEIDLSERDEMFAKLRQQMRGHNGIQQGPYIICTSCPMRHSWYVGVDRQLMGWSSNGTPIIKTIDKP